MARGVEGGMELEGVRGDWEGEIPIRQVEVWFFFFFLLFIYLFIHLYLYNSSFNHSHFFPPLF